MNTFNFSVSLLPNPTAINGLISSTVVFSTDFINPTESSLYSVWDLQWQNWFSGGSLGSFEYYCPDSRCPGNSAGWKAVSANANIPQSWIIMNAIRWRPINAGNLQANLTGVMGGWTGTQTVSLTASNAFPASANLSLPYTGSCTPSISNLTATGAITGAFPWGSFIGHSPIRPLCGIVNVVRGQTAELGDLIITPSRADAITANAWYGIQSNLRVPSGFTPLRFTGTKSKIGVVETVLEVSTSSVIQFLTPQLHFNHAQLVSGKQNVGALVYDPDDGSSWYLAAQSYNADPLNPFRIGMILASSAILVFGTLDNTINRELPATIGKTVYYVGEWNSKTLMFGPINATISGRSDMKIIVSRSAPLASNFEASSSYYVGVSGANSRSSVVLSHAATNGSSWA
jgi:hypothetical protein